METTSALVTFAGKVFDRLPAILDDRDGHVITLGIIQCFNEGWSVDDTVAVNLCLQECGCELDEDVACARIKKLRDKYKK